MKYKNSTRLTVKILKDFGFTTIVKDPLDRRPWYRMTSVPRSELGWYWGQLQVKLGDYPKENGNCGVFAVHHPAEWAVPAPTNENVNNTIDMQERTIYIAWRIWDVGRLKTIVKGLTEYDLDENTIFVVDDN